MARSKAMAPANNSTALAQLDNELSNEVAILKSALNAPSGNAIKIKPAGNFISPDGFDLGDEIQLVVLDFINKNFFYSGPFVEGNPSPPDCFAMSSVVSLTKGTDVTASMVPDLDVPNRQNDKCATCPQNQFGSGANGRSKACKNTRELAVLLVDPDNPDAHNTPDAPIYTLSLSPTNIRPFDAIVTNVARVLNGPPIKAIITATAKNVGTYAQIAFVDPVPNPDVATHIARRSEAREMLERKPDFTQRAATPNRQAPRRGGAAPTRTATSGRR